MAVASTSLSTSFPASENSERELRFVVNCFLQFSLLPYFHILPVNTTNQPIGALIAGMAMFLGYRIAKTPIALLMCLTLTVACIWTVFTLLDEPSHAGAITQETIGYFTNAVAFIFAINYQRYYSRRLLRFNLLILTPIGLMQFGVFSQSAGVALNTFLLHIITNIPTTVYTTRGVPLLTSEPSTGAEALGLYFYLWLLRDFPGAGKLDRVVYATCFLLLFATNSSGTLVSFIAVSGLTYILFSGRRAILSLLAIVPLGWLLYYLTIETGLAPKRLQILFSVLSQVFQVTQPAQLLVPMTMLSGYRFAVIIMGLGTPLYAPFGNGIAQWSWGLLDVARKFGIDFRKLPLNVYEVNLNANKPNSFASTFVYETGWIAYAILALIAFSVLRALRQHRHASYYRLLACAVAVGLVQILVNGQVFLSSPWLLVAMAYQRPERWSEDMVWHNGKTAQALSS